MHVIRNILLLTALAAGFLTKRDYTTVQADLRALYVATNALATTSQQVRSNNTDTQTQSIVSTAYLFNNLTNSIRDLNNSTVLTGAQAGVFLKNLTATLYPGLRSALNGVVAKRKNYTDTGYSAGEHSLLMILSTQVTSYGGAAVAKVPVTSSSSASKVSSSFSALAASAFSAFNAT